ncbi:MAG: 2-dehydropantoate 2-reductase [Rhodospirillaceae bacterium]|nr:2-dehydropantoate 2-reductase [Rhodospirillaceae bacterium]
MRILVLGAGATGGYFGGRLAAAGADVTFLVRPRRAAQLAANGLVIQSPAGDWRGPVKTVSADSLADGYDLVLLACKAYDLDAAIEAIRPAMAATMAGETRVLPILNGMRQLDRLDAAFGAERVLGGSCQIGVTLTPSGEVRHMGRFAVLTFGARSAGQRAVAERFAAAAAGALFEARNSPDVLRDMWEKFVMITTNAGMTTLMRATIGDIAGTRHGPKMMTAVLAECAAVAEAAGYGLDPRMLAGLRGWLTEKGSTFSSSMLRDTERRGPIEADHIVGDMIARAESARIDAPMLRIIYTHLQAYEARGLREGWAPATS